MWKGEWKWKWNSNVTGWLIWLATDERRHHHLSLSALKSRSRQFQFTIIMKQETAKTFMPLNFREELEPLFLSGTMRGRDRGRLVLVTCKQEKWNRHDMGEDFMMIWGRKLEWYLISKSSGLFAHHRGWDIFSFTMHFRWKKGMKTTDGIQFLSPPSWSQNPVASRDSFMDWLGFYHPYGGFEIFTSYNSVDWGGGDDERRRELP